MKNLIIAAALFCSVPAVAGQYIWYPGQLAAYLQRQQLQRSKERCVNVGYPGKFTQPAPATWFRKGAEVTKLSSDGHLPALYVDNPSEWEVSLDGEQWNIAETDGRFTKKGQRPDAEQETITTLRPSRLIPLRNADGLHLRQSACLLVDFHELEVGSVSLTAQGNARLTFRVGETPEEALNTDEKYFEQRPIVPYKVQGRQEIALPERALRYVAIFCDGDAQLSDIEFHAKLWPVSQQLTFHSSDSLLNTLFEVGVKTLHTSMHNFYLDGVKRDYLPWAMDGIVSQMAADYLFGDRQVTRNSISIALMPAQPSVSDWGIVDYPLHALIGIKHDYLHYGDLTTVRMFRDRIRQQLDLYEQQQDDRGFIVAQQPTTGYIPGWSRDQGPADYGVAAYGQMMLYENFRIAAYFSRILGDNRQARHYEQRAKALGSSIMKHFWDDSRHAFINGYDQAGNLDRRLSHHAQYWAVLTGLYPKKYIHELFTTVLPSMDYYKKNISYEKGYEALAYIRTGHVQQFYDLLKEVWGGWLAEDQVRFPENFSIQTPFPEQLTFYGRPFGLSLCHGANGVPPVLLALNGILGFSQSETHPNEYTFNPNLLHLTHAEGSIPVKEGVIRVSFNSHGPSTIEIPAGCVVTYQNRKFTKAGSYQL